MMNIVLNFIPLKKGGGVQVGLDFISQAIEYGKDHNWYLVASHGTPFASLKPTKNFKILKIIPNRVIDRLYFEYFSCKKVLQEIDADVVYTQFGPHWPGSGLPNIAGCAYSNLMYPEIDFWGKLPFLERLKKKVIDQFRLKRMLQADVVAFETEDLANRAINLYGMAKGRVHFVKPSVSSLVSPTSLHEDTALRCEKIPQGYRILLLSGYHPNKNFELLPQIAHVLASKYKINNVVFVTTIPSEHFGAIGLARQSRELGVQDNIYNIGPIPYEGCCEIYKSCQAVILPSQLESFSNNIAEAWAMSKPLIISELDWAKSLCGDAAVYYKYNDAQDVAVKIQELLKNNGRYKEVTSRGENMLKKYSNSKERFFNYLNIIEKCSQ